jgi:glycosyltransferase involved in cell wall biosynthesis
VGLGVLPAYDSPGGRFRPAGSVQRGGIICTLLSGGPFSERTKVVRTSPALRILLVGGRILPYRHAGDKNYWLDVIHELGALGHDVRVLSVTLESVTEPAEFRCEYVRPIPVYLGRRTRFNEEYRRLRGTNNYASKTLSFGRIVRAIRRQIRTDRPDVIHLSSNFGPIMAVLKSTVRGVPLSISAPTYNGGTPLYDGALRTSFHGFDAVVPFSDAFGNRLRQIGLSPGRLRTIRWGVDLERFHPPSEAERETARQELGVRDGERVAFWAGYLQQMGPGDFEFAAQVAERVTHLSPGAWRFFFCFKPEHYDPAFRRFEGPGVALGGSSETFHRAQRAADVMVSPIGDLRSTAAPPLTWIESLAMGVPLVTTPIPGAEEVVTDGLNGYLIRSPEEAASRLVELVRSPESLLEARRQARRRVEDRFALSSSVADYVRLWSAMAARLPAP